MLPYFDPYIFLFLGGMCIAAAMQQWNLHRRIALTIMRAIGTDPRRLLFGVLAATAFVSLWISNTATATMMLPIGLSVIAQLETHAGGRRLEHYGAALMLAVAYAANVGGIGTKIGTAPNAQFASFMAQRGVEISFLEYMAVGIPFVLLFLPVVWLALWRIGRRDAPSAEAGRDVLRAEIAELGRMQREEWVVLVVFLIAAAPLDRRSAAHRLAQAARHAARAPLRPRRGGHRDERGGLADAAAQPRPAGARAARAAADSLSRRCCCWAGASRWRPRSRRAGSRPGWPDSSRALRESPAWAQLLLASLTTVALSAVASNVATIAVMLSVLASSVAPAIATTALFTATVAASCDFALPAGTPPNAIVFGSGYLTVPRMAKTGVVLDLAAALLAAGLCALLVPRVL